jgi:cyclopropane fatty-acyl-phospholipid synthase-like methyltransferase
MDYPRFPRASAYHPDWIVARGSGGGNALLLTEWLCERLTLQPGMRVLDLGCGKAMSSIFMHREFGVDVWAADLWFSAEQNLQAVRDARVEAGVHPVHCDAHALPFAAQFFDAVVSIDSFQYYGTDDLYAYYLAHFVKPGGTIAMAGAGLTKEFDGQVPEALQGWWEPMMNCLHTADWWRRHWERSGILSVSHVDTLPDAWRYWLDWQRWVAPNNQPEIAALERDQGRVLTYVRAVAQRRADAVIDPPMTTVQSQYVRQPLLRGDA